MKKNLFTLLFFLVFFPALHFSFAQRGGGSDGKKTLLPSVEPLFLYDEGESFDDEDIIKAALEFSECPFDSQKGQAVFAKYLNLKASVTSPSFTGLSQSDRAEKILSLMYDTVIQNYKERQTKIDLLFDEGSYNCVSSSVLYLALAKASGLDVRAQITPNHAFCTLYPSDGSAGAKTKIDIETTNPYGFNPGSRRELRENDTNRGNYTIVPKRNYSGRHEAEDKILVSLIGANLGADYDKAGNWQKSVPLFAACVAFTRDCDERANKSREEFEKTCTNFVVSLQRERQFGTILEWLDVLYERWGAGKNLQGTYENAVANNVSALCKTASFSSAKECLLKRREKISSQKTAQIEQQIFESEVQWNLDACGGNDEAIAYLQTVRSLEIAKSPRNSAKIKQRLEHYWLNKINAAQAEGKYLYAASIADEGLLSVPSSGLLSGARKNCLRNYDAFYHNKFADLANKKQYEAALDVLKEGLRGNPDSQVLNKDLKSLQNLIKNE